MRPPANTPLGRTDSGDSTYPSGSGEDTVTVNSSVGTITQVIGAATITHADGSVTPVVAGSPIAAGDVLETSADGAIETLFADGTSFVMSENARITVDQLLYNASTNDGSSLFSVLQGVFVWTSGLIGKSDPDRRADRDAGRQPGHPRATEFILRVAT